MSNVAKSRKTKELTGDTFKIAHDAKAAKKADDHVIDATVGALFDDDGRFHVFKSIVDVIQKIDHPRQFAYPPIDGGHPFQKSLLSWVFQKHAKKIEDTFFVDLVATPGACGALHNAFLNYIEKDDVLIMPDICWTNYRSILSNIERTYVTYPMFKDDQFNIDGLKTRIEQVLKTSQRIVLMFNDPAHNPTGYSLKEVEWRMIYAYIFDLIESGISVTVIYDLAYLDYAGKTFDDSRAVFDPIMGVHENLLMLFAFSGSKTFSLYGQRIGALIALSKNHEQIEAFGRAARFVSRSTWSCPPATGLRLIEDLSSIDDQFIFELNQARDVLGARSKTFIEEAKRVGLRHYPYDSGFFITLITDNPKQTYKRLAEHGIFGIPVDRGFRLALSSLALADVRGLAKRIKAVI